MDSVSPHLCLMLVLLYLACLHEFELSWGPFVAPTSRKTCQGRWHDISECCTMHLGRRKDSLLRTHMRQGAHIQTHKPHPQTLICMNMPEVLHGTVQDGQGNDAFCAVRRPVVIDITRPRHPALDASSLGCLEHHPLTLSRSGRKLGQTRSYVLASQGINRGVEAGILPKRRMHGPCPAEGHSQGPTTAHGYGLESNTLPKFDRRPWGTCVARFLFVC